LALHGWNDAASAAVEIVEAVIRNGYPQLPETDAAYLARMHAAEIIERNVQAHSRCMNRQNILLNAFELTAAGN
jgi:hypothetical protein